nr:integrase, catalytic region, zinc finger, CCHC-type, peptidase aspartic, catalytic [Tanacetum cinerariifolium]
KTKMLLAKKDKDEQVLLAEDQALMESSSDSDQEINANMVFIAQIEKVLSDSEASSSFADEKISEIVQICLWIIDSGCSKHMMGNRALLTNFVEKFLRTVRFGNNDFAVIAGYGDVVIGSMTIKKDYYVEGLGHNLFSVGQFCDKGLEAAFRKSTCFVRNEDGVDLLTDDRSIEPANVAEALKDADWVSAMQDEIDQFARLKVWRLGPRPDGKTIIKTKWIFKNKKDESILVIRNK